MPGAYPARGIWCYCYLSFPHSRGMRFDPKSKFSKFARYSFNAPTSTTTQWPYLPVVVVCGQSYLIFYSRAPYHLSTRAIEHEICFSPKGREVLALQIDTERIRRNNPSVFGNAATFAWQVGGPRSMLLPVETTPSPRCRRPTQIWFSASAQWKAAHCRSCAQCRDAMAVLDEKQLDWTTPLTNACIDGRKSCVEAILKAPETVIDFANSDGHTAMHAACMFGYTDCVRMLIEAGATLDVPDHEGATAIDGARMVRTDTAESCVAMLVAAGARDTSPTCFEGREHEALKERSIRRPGHVVRRVTM